MATLSNRDYESNWNAFEEYQDNEYYMYRRDYGVPDYNNWKVLDKLLSDYEKYEDEYFLFESGFTVLTKEQAWEQYLSEIEDQEYYDYQESGQDMDDFCTYAYWLGALRNEDGYFTIYDTQGNLIIEYTKEPSWETLYEMYCEEQERLEDKYFSGYYYLPWHNHQQEINIKERVYSRKKKHVKDNLHEYSKNLRKTEINYCLSMCDCDRCCTALGVCNREVLHKHLRSQKQYENFYTAYEYENLDFSWDEEFEDDDWFLNEIGLPHYVLGFDWEQELLESGYYENGITPFVNNIIINP